MIAAGATLWYLWGMWMVAPGSRPRLDLRSSIATSRTFPAKERYTYIDESRPPARDGAERRLSTRAMPGMTFLWFPRPDSFLINDNLLIPPKADTSNVVIVKGPEHQGGSGKDAAEL